MNKVSQKDTTIKVRKKAICKNILASQVLRREQVEECLRLVPQDTNRALMVGVLASTKTLNRQNFGHYPRWSKVTKIAGIFVPHPNVLNLVHFNDWDNLPNPIGIMNEIPEEIGVGVAGGLCAENLAQLSNFTKFPSNRCIFPNWDAEGCLRDLDDHLDIEKARDYIKSSYELLIPPPARR